METSNDVQALEKISTEVDESQVKVILSSQCIKAQAFLVDKLRKQTERNKEVSGFIRSDNLKLEAEIKNAEQEIRSMLIAQDTIKSANVELRKDWLLAKNKKEDIKERVEIGVKKYEALWAECKERYESIPFVQKYLKTKEKTQSLKNDIDSHEILVQNAYKDIEMRRNVCKNLDRQRVIELANFMINEMPTKHKLIKEKFEAVNELAKQIDEVSNELAAFNVTEVIEKELIVNTEVKVVDEVDLTQLCKNDDDNLIPKLEMQDYDFDAIDVNFKQMKMKKIEILNTAAITTERIDSYMDSDSITNKEDRLHEFIISPYFHKPIHDETRNYSKRKLINILEDVKIDNSEAYNIVSKVNPDKFQTVDTISAEAVPPKEKDNMTLENEDIELIDLTSSNKESIIIPPTQFLDITGQVSQESLSKKRVSFDLSTMQIDEVNEDVVEKQNETETSEQHQTSQLDISAASDESFMKIKDMILKKHNLDLSPQFVYAKNNMLQKNDEDKVVTSKFFEHEQKSADEENLNNVNMDVQPEPQIQEEPSTLMAKDDIIQSQKDPTEDVLMDVDVMVASSPKNKAEDNIRTEVTIWAKDGEVSKMHSLCDVFMDGRLQDEEQQRIDKPVTGLLFTHNAQGIPDSLNVSISTTGYEDSDFPHCIDSSLLLSPKGDLPMTGDNVDIISQEVPNFLSGLRKTGLSFFGGGPSTSSKPDAAAQNQSNNFSFNFGGDGKKNRGGGLFSMFQ